MLQRPLEAAPEVVAAIAAAAEICWPKAATRAPGEWAGGRRVGGPEYVWRFSGRWWQRPVPLRRDRPWTEQEER